MITGLGAVTPLGNDVQTLWANLLAGKCGVTRISHFDPSGFDTQIAGEVKELNCVPSFPSPKEVRRSDRFTQLAIAAAHQALLDSKLDLELANRDEIGVFIGSGIGGLHTTEEQHKILLQKGPGRMSPFMIPMLILNMASGVFSMYYKLRGPQCGHLLGLRHRQPCHRRSLADHQNGRCPGDVCRRFRSDDHPPGHRRFLRDESHEHPQRRAVALLPAF